MFKAWYNIRQSPHRDFTSVTNVKVNSLDSIWWCHKFMENLFQFSSLELLLNLTSEFWIKLQERRIILILNIIWLLGVLTANRPLQQVLGGPGRVHRTVRAHWLTADWTSSGYLVTDGAVQYSGRTTFRTFQELSRLTKAQLVLSWVLEGLNRGSPT